MCHGRVQTWEHRGMWLVAAGLTASLWAALRPVGREVLGPMAAVLGTMPRTSCSWAYDLTTRSCFLLKLCTGTSITQITGGWWWWAWRPQGMCGVNPTKHGNQCSWISPSPTSCCSAPAANRNHSNGDFLMNLFVYC